MKFAMSGQLYRGSKPVMWSVVEKTALAEAEIEYQDYQSDTVWVKFPIHSIDDDGSKLQMNYAAHRWRSGPPRPGRFPATAPSPIRRASPMGSIR